MPPFNPSTPSGWPVLSVRQPWAELILADLKRYESRTWETRYRGPLWLHAPRSIDRSVEFHSADQLTVGAVVGVIVLREIVRLRPNDPAEFDSLGGPVYWSVRPLYRLERPVECAGKLNLWSLHPRALRACRQQLPR
jgi:hypothetical protein